VREIATWLVRIVVGTVALGLCQVWGVIFALGVWWVGGLVDVCRSALRRLWKHG
jgi:hypothetical protein